MCQDDGRAVIAADRLAQYNGKRSVSAEKEKKNAKPCWCDAVPMLYVV